MSSSDASTETTAAASASPATSTASAAGSAAPAPASLPGRRGADPYRVVMVCTGNICRSAMAEVVLRDRLAAAGIPDSGPGGVTVASAGVSDEERGNPIDSRARRVLTEAGYGVGADDVSRATASAIASHTAHRVTDTEITEADLLLAMTDSHWNVLQRRAAGLGAEPDRIRMYRELDPACAQDAEAVTGGESSRGVLNVPDPWYGTMADFLDTLEVVERVSDELAEQLTALRD
ncbi:low molecular weight protein-tyrosine-phosphatase [Actinomyces oris]|uniref:low molecular weight protein-tyrosine-phosphatase n=1 Tax=Actinomyces oris TaxID=544580 RepID=UPI002116A48B|nr:low molecular weight protein-tyrosine-phosphatase [Actinomyces oris]